MALLKFGPSGGYKGNRFDDTREIMLDNTVNIGVINIRSDGNRVDSIQTVYYRQNGSNPIELTDIHGGRGGTLHEFNLRRGEIIIKLEGTISNPWENTIVIRSLKFTTNQENPEGRELEFGTPSVENDADGVNRRYFEYNVPSNGHIIEFFGNAGDNSNLDALGIIVRTP